jgi:hypothetical protein
VPSHHYCLAGDSEGLITRSEPPGLERKTSFSWPSLRLDISVWSELRDIFNKPIHDLCLSEVIYLNVGKLVEF